MGVILFLLVGPHRAASMAVVGSSGDHAAAAGPKRSGGRRGEGLFVSRGRPKGRGKRFLGPIGPDPLLRSRDRGAAVLRSDQPHGEAACDARCLKGKRICLTSGDSCRLTPVEGMTVETAAPLPEAPHARVRTPCLNTARSTPHALRFALTDTSCTRPTRTSDAGTVLATSLKRFSARPSAWSHGSVEGGIPSISGPPAAMQVCHAVSWHGHLSP
jgi:hypothetical protein